MDAVSGDHPANQVVQSDPRNVARHHDAQGLRLTGPGFLLQPAQPRLDRLRFKGVQPHLCSMLNFGQAEPAIVVLCSAHGGMQRGPSLHWGVADGGHQSLAQSTEQGAGAFDIDRTGGDIVGFHGYNWMECKDGPQHWRASAVIFATSRKNTPWPS